MVPLMLLGVPAASRQENRAPMADTLQVKRSGDSLTVSTPTIHFEMDLKTGLYSLRWEAQREIRGATCSALLSNGTPLKASSYARHVCDDADITPIKDGFGTGLKIVVHHRNEGRPELRQTLRLYREKPYAFVQVEVLSPTEIASNHLSPLVIDAGPQAGIEMDAGDPLQVLFVPFDNDEFVRYNSHDWGPQADSFEVTAFYENKTRHGFVFGSVDHDLWKTGFAIRQIDKQRVGALEVYTGATGYWSHDKVPHGLVRGTSIASPRIFVGWFADWREGMEAFGKANSIVTPPLPWSGGTPFGWNSWAAHKDKVTAEQVVAASDFLRQTLQPHGFESGRTVYINMDAFWDFIPEMQFLQTVAHIHAQGQKAGIYWTPFAGWWDDLNHDVEGTEGRYTYRDIVLKDEKGEPLPKLDRGWPLDPTHPGTQMRNDWQFRRFLRWGFDFVKLDFMSHGALEGVHYDKTVPTGIAAYNKGMKQILATFDAARVGRPVFLSLSIAPLFPSGYAHSRRISCDAFADIGQTEYLLNAATYGWWTQGTLYAYNDPDHTVVYKVHNESPVSEAEGRSRLNASLIAGTVLLNSDDLTDTGARKRVEALFTNEELNVLARRGQSFRPVEGDTGAQAADLFVLKTRETFYVGAFNFDRNAEARKTVPFERIGLDPTVRFRFRDLWTQQVTVCTGSFPLTLKPRDSTIFQVTRE